MSEHDEGRAEGRTEMYHDLWAYWHEAGQSALVTELDKAFRIIQEGAS